MINHDVYATLTSTEKGIKMKKLRMVLEIYMENIWWKMKKGETHFTDAKTLR